MSVISGPQCFYIGDEEEEENWDEERGGATEQGLPHDGRARTGNTDQLEDSDEPQVDHAVSPRLASRRPDVAAERNSLFADER